MGIDWPTGHYETIVADPPWAYRLRPNDPTHRATCPYPCMSTGDVAALPVGELAADGCALWLWTTNAHLQDALFCLARWGFTHKTMLTWAKRQIGCGDWLRGQTEHCLLGIRGKPTWNIHGESTVLLAPRREHSQKPAEFYSMVERLQPDARRVELFARCRRPGWVSWGDQVDALGVEGVQQCLTL